MSTIEKQLNDESKPWAKWFALGEEKTGLKRLYLFGSKWQTSIVHNHPCYSHLFHWDSGVMST